MDSRVRSRLPMESGPSRRWKKTTFPSCSPRTTPVGCDLWDRHTSALTPRRTDTIPSVTTGTHTSLAPEQDSTPTSTTYPGGVWSSLALGEKRRRGPRPKYVTSTSTVPDGLPLPPPPSTLKGGLTRGWGRGRGRTAPSEARGPKVRTGRRHTRPDGGSWWFRGRTRESR